MLLHLKSSYKAYDSLNSLNIVSGDFPDNGNTSVCWYPMHKVEKWSTVVWVFTKFMASLPKVCQKTNPVQRHVECCTECGICTMYELYKSFEISMGFTLEVTFMDRYVENQVSSKRIFVNILCIAINVYSLSLIMSISIHIICLKITF